MRQRISSWRGARRARRQQPQQGPRPTRASPISTSRRSTSPPDDPALVHFQSAAGPVDLDTVSFDSRAGRELQQAGVKLVVPPVARGELIGLINLGPRLSEQEYTSDDRRLLESLASQAAPALRVAQLVREQEAEAAERERIAQDLRVATLIQQNFLPRQLPAPEEWDIAAFYRPAREVGRRLLRLHRPGRREARCVRR